MKSISLLAATAMLAATSVQASFDLTFYTSSVCLGAGDPQDFAPFAGNGFGNGECQRFFNHVGKDYRAARITSCDGHSLCACELHLDTVCGGPGVVIEWESNRITEAEFCDQNAADAGSARCYYL